MSNTIDQNEASNPYAAPDSNVETHSNDSKIEVFDRFSAWGVFFITWITAGVYMIYWTYSRTPTLNSVVENKISLGFVWATLAIYIVYFISSFLPVFLVFIPGFPEMFLVAIYAVTGLLLLPVIIMPIVWVFKIRNRINQITGSEKGDLTYAGGAMTFFFHVVYLQYKINQNIDTLREN